MSERLPVTTYRDGSKVFQCYGMRKYAACWADGTPLRGDNDQRSLFETHSDAAEALAAGGEGPAKQ